MTKAREKLEQFEREERERLARGRHPASTGEKPGLSELVEKAKLAVRLRDNVAAENERLGLSRPCGCRCRGYGR